MYLFPFSVKQIFCWLPDLLFRFGFDYSRLVFVKSKNGVWTVLEVEDGMVDIRYACSKDLSPGLVGIGILKVAFEA